MKRIIATLGLLFAGALAYAGTPQVTFFQGQGSLSNTTIIASTGTPTSNGTFSLTVTSPTVVNSGGGAFIGRNCFTRFVVQAPTTTVVNMYDGSVLKWTLYGQGFGTAALNTLNINEDPMGPWCTTNGNQAFFTMAGTGSIGVPESFNVEGYTTYGAGSTLNQGSSY